MHDDINLAALPLTELEELFGVQHVADDGPAFPERVPLSGLGPTGLSLLTTDQARLQVDNDARRQRLLADARSES